MGIASVYYRSPEWSPDGTTLGCLLYAVSIFGSIRDIELISVSTGAVQQIFAGSSGPIWSPDGRILAASFSASFGSGGPREIFAQELAAGNSGPVYLTANSVDEWPTSWKP
jgi:Tol biopolymer transport system component